MRDVIVGGGGWASRAAQAVLLTKFNQDVQRISVYGSTSRREQLEDGNIIEIKEWIGTKEESNTRYFLPFAFLTVDKFDLYGEEKYKNTNRVLIKNALDFISRNKPKYCVLFSSGITHSRFSISDRPRAYMVYRELKLEEEKALKMQCNVTGTKLVICRLFNASGRFIPSLHRYALSNLIYQGIVHGRIQVKSSFPVVRKYIDMEQLLEICLLAVEGEQELEFDSTGSLVELHDLAAMCAKELSVEYSRQLMQTAQSDNYFSSSTDTETLAKRYNIPLYPIERQIQETINGVKKLIDRGLLH